MEWHLKTVTTGTLTLYKNKKKNKNKLTKFIF